ncbi:MAG: hypothetical protein FGM55_09070 [Rhodoferax sp.]|nr:hypothetical protein [Rhodoferax sp.]
MSRWLRRLPGSTRSPSGLEWQLWKRLPLIGLVGALLPLTGMALGAWQMSASHSPADIRDWMQWNYALIGVLILHLTLLVTVAIGCVVVMVMKGPAYVADGYPLPEPDRPLPEQRSC